MPKYFMHIYDGHDRIEDEEGFEAENLAAARAEAKRLIKAMITDLVYGGHGPDGQYADLRNERGQVLHVLTFQEVLREG